MNFFENITFRKARSQSLTELSSANSSTISLKLDGSTNSIPNISTDNNIIVIEDLKQKIELLSTQLNLAHERINYLSNENKEIKETLNVMLNYYEGHKKKTEKIYTEENPSNRHKNIITTHENSEYNSKNEPHSIENTQNVIIPSTIYHDKLSKCRIRENNNKEKIQNKLCIISANKTSKILSIAEERFKNTQICHWLYPNCGIRHLIKNIHKKLHEYTMDDHCVILIGEEDFRKTENYFEIITEIRNTLKLIQNTNIIICLPTYKYSNLSPVFNWRIETFNNLLYLDITTYNYAYLLDCNLNLKCDYSMFSKYTGRVNNGGMKNIFDNIFLLVNNNCKSSAAKSRSITYCDKSTHTEEMSNMNNLNITKTPDHLFRV
ncbi:unnamed protein product, partial [Brenthis ino]